MEVESGDLRLAEGLRKHPFERDLTQLRDDIKQRLLMTAVRP
jgi:hypothetical protein